MIDSFHDIFKQSLLMEDDLDIKLDPQDDDAAFKASLDKGTPEDTFDVKGLGGDTPGQADYINTAKEWIHKLDNFSNEINGLEPSSLNMSLHSLDQEGSVFRGVVKDMAADLVGVSETLKSLSEQLKGYIIGAGKKQQELDSQRNV